MQNRSPQNEENMMIFHSRSQPAVKKYAFGGGGGGGGFHNFFYPLSFILSRTMFPCLFLLKYI